MPVSSSDGVFNFFALLSADGEAEVRRIVVESQLQVAMGQEFATQRQTLFGDQSEEVRFDGRYKADENEVLYVEGLSLPPPVGAAVHIPTSVAPLTAKDDDLDRLKAIFAGRWRQNAPELILQTFDRRRLLTKRFTLLIRRDTFTKMADAGLVLDTRAAAAYQNNRLYFRSFDQARRIFDLSAYYREATTTDLKRFAKLKSLALEDSESFVSDSDSWVRRRIAMILDSDLLDKCKPHDIAKKARKYRLNVRLQDGRLVIPSDKKEMKDLLHFLDENYYTSDLTGKQFLTNSKRPLWRFLS